MLLFGSVVDLPQEPLRYMMYFGRFEIALVAVTVTLAILVGTISNLG